MKSRGFSLVEVLVACAVLMILMVVLAGMVGLTSRTWLGTRGKISQFQQARAAYDALTGRLAEATLNPVLDYVDAAGSFRTAGDRNFVPARYVRRSDLRFLSGPGLTGRSGATSHGVFFQSPQGASETLEGLDQLLNTCGFFVELGNDQTWLPSILPDSYARTRFRLLQLVEPSEQLGVYSGSGVSWFQKSLTDGTGVSVAAENVVALIILPKLSPADQAAGGFDDAALAPNYLYDSTVARSEPALNSSHQLPPIIQVTMVALSETSAARMTPAEQNELKSFVDSLFQAAGSTIDPAIPGLARDLASLGDFLASRGLTYEVFTSNVALKAAKWSRSQAL